MKRLILAALVSLCLLTPTIAGEIDGTGKTPPPPPPNCTQNCTSAQQLSTRDQISIQVAEMLAWLLAAR